MRRLYRDRRDMLLNCLLENCSDSLIPQQSDAGMHILADLKHGIEDQTAHKALLAHGIDSLPLSVYCSEPIQRSALVLGFSGVPRKAMPRLTKKLGEKLRSLHSGPLLGGSRSSAKGACSARAGCRNNRRVFLRGAAWGFISGAGKAVWGICR